VTKEDVVMAQGTVTDLVRDAMIVKLDCGPQLRAPLSGRMRTNRVRVVAGDRVCVELTPYDMSRGRVVYRFK
jgi:translation initiation factor IF-1